MRAVWLSPVVLLGDGNPVRCCMRKYYVFPGSGKLTGMCSDSQHLIARGVDDQLLRSSTSGRIHRPTLAEMRRPSALGIRSRPRDRRSWLVPVLFSSLLLLFLLHAAGSVLRRANALGRRCMPGDAGTGEEAAGGSFSGRIAMVSFSEERWRGQPRRSFRGLMETVRANKVGYTVRWGYDFIDARGVVDRSRPASWSKILAIRSHLKNYDWIFWNDADSVVTNPKIPLEGILQSVIGHTNFSSSPDLVVTEDMNGINAGMFFVRRSSWSVDFLDSWWNLTSFVRFGSTKSGDNDALKHLIRRLSPCELRDHVRVSRMQCAFNSYPWIPTWKTAYRLITGPRTAWRGAYSDGDFMVHLAGIDDKKKWAVKILREMETKG